MRTFAWILTISLAICGCQQIDNSPPATTVQQQNFRGHPYLAGFALTESAQETPLQLFIAPSCHLSMRLLFNTLRELENAESPLGQYDVQAIMIPRKDSDIPIIAGLMCIDRERRGDAIISYYRNVYERSRDRVIDEAVANAAYFETLEKFGIADPERKGCEESEASRALIARSFVLVDEGRTQNRTPAIFLNGGYLPVLTFGEMMERI